MFYLSKFSVLWLFSSVFFLRSFPIPFTGLIKPRRTFAIWTHILHSGKKRSVSKEYIFSAHMRGVKSYLCPGGIVPFGWAMHWLPLITNSPVQAQSGQKGIRCKFGVCNARQAGTQPPVFVLYATIPTFGRALLKTKKLAFCCRVRTAVYRLNTTYQEHTYNKLRTLR